MLGEAGEVAASGVDSLTLGGLFAAELGHVFCDFVRHLVLLSRAGSGQSSREGERKNFEVALRQVLPNQIRFATAGLGGHMQRHASTGKILGGN